MSDSDDFCLDTYDPEETPFLPNDYWQTKDGERLLPEQMSKQHRENAIRMIAKNHFEGNELKALMEYPILWAMFKLNMGENK